MEADQADSPVLGTEYEVAPRVTLVPKMDLFLLN
jgi:hypothetical protein